MNNYEKLIDKLDAELDDVSAWHLTKEFVPHLEHKSGVQLWIASGEDCLSVWRPTEIKLTRADQRRLWKKIRVWQDRAADESAGEVIDRLEGYDE
jgi:hypothetical protein